MNKIYPHFFELTEKGDIVPFDEQNSSWKRLYCLLKKKFGKDSRNLLSFESPPESSRRLIILFAKMKALSLPITYNNLVIASPNTPILLRPIEKPTTNTSEITKEYCPMLTIGLENIMTLFEKKPLDKQFRVFTNFKP